jgi:hypothetical protein
MATRHFIFPYLWDLFCLLVGFFSIALQFKVSVLLLRLGQEKVLFFSFFAVLFYDSIAFWFSLGSFVCCLYISNRFVTFVLGEHYNLQEGQILMLFPSLGCLLKWRIRFRTRRTLCVEVGLIGVADRQCRLVLTLFV